MKTIKVKTQSIKETASAVIDNNTVILNYELINDKTSLIQFSVIRGIETDDDYTGQQIMGGSVERTGFGNVHLVGKDWQEDTGILVGKIFNLCINIFHNNIQKEEENVENSNL